MNESVEEAKEGRMAAGCKLDAEPHGHWHHAVMNHMQRANVVVFLAKDEEELHKKQ